MDFKKLKERRTEYNKLVVEKINKILENSDLRFNQLMYIINGTDDHFNEEPWVTLKRIDEKFPNY